MSADLDRISAALAERYVLDREIGRGGMATVYLATDLKHKRQVAIKVLSPDMAAALGTERFLKEIELEARLTHPHILALHDSGQVDGRLYYVMPYVAGESLRQRLDREKQLPLEDAVRIVREVADALAYAHGVGIVHRDVKPENILLESGHAVLTDFGIARAVSESGGERLTQTGIAVGSPAYMSPEQAAGRQDVDPRSDIYALGCVLYEMLGGEPPFTGPTPRAVMARHAVDAVPNLKTIRPTTPQPIQAVVEKALAKVPADRFSTALGFSVALEAAMAPGASPGPRRRAWWAVAGVAAAGAVTLLLVDPFAGEPDGGGPSGAGAATIESLVVLPFDNRSGDQEEEHFVAGMQEALIGELARLGALRVISRTSAARFQGSQQSIPEIADALNVEGVVEGSVYRTGDSVHIQVHLIQARPEESHIWTRSYAREMSDVLAIFSDVAQAVAHEVDVELAPQKATRLASTRQVDPETYELYLRGMHHVNKLTPEGFETGLSYLNQAVDADPADPLPYAGLASAWAAIGHTPRPPPDALPRARAAALRALQLDQTVAEAHGALAEVQLYLDWDPVAADSSFRRALELNPGLATTRANYAWFLRIFDRIDESQEEMRLALRLDPLSPIFPTWTGWMHVWDERYEEAVMEAEKALELAPGFPIANYVLGSAYAGLGRFDDAIAAHERAGEMDPDWKWGLGVTHALAGHADEARAVAREIEVDPTQWNTWGIAEIYATLGERETALQWVQEAFDQRHSYVPWLAQFPAFEPLHDDPRFQDLVRRGRTGG